MRGVVDVGDFGGDPQLDTPRRQNDRREIQGHAVGLLDEPDLADAASAETHCCGMGIVPPAMNFALSPDTAVTVGSASVWETP